MVVLIMTTSIVEALEAVRELRDGKESREKGTLSSTESDGAQSEKEPSLEEPAMGNPISHGQIVDLWKKLQNAQPGDSRWSLEVLLRGARVYVPPPPPKREPTPEFKALMARLRREEEARSYERMMNPSPLSNSRETFHDRFPHASTTAASFAAANRPINIADLGDDEVTHNEIHRQVTLIINFLVSIVGVAATLWVAARWWSTPARLFLTMGGSILVAVAEVAVYMTYVWKMGDAKSKQDGLKEVREIVQTWVMGEGEDDKDKQSEEKVVVVGDKKATDGEAGVRKRVIPQGKDDT